MAVDTLDIFSPVISTVSKDVKGKLILIHSNERKLGKTLQATRFPKPFYLRFEQGINAISGLPYAPLTKWADFKKVRKQLTNPKTIEEAQKRYQTLIVDTTDVAIRWCERYVCGMLGVDRIKDANNGYGGWSEYANEWFNEWNPLLNAGYTIIFIAHSEVRKMKDSKTNTEYEQWVPKGDKRTIDLIVDAADLIGFVRSNGYDEEGNPQMSSIYFQNCPEFIAGSRFKYMSPEITPFTAEGVQDALAKAIEQEEMESGIASVTYEEQVAVSMPKEMSYNEAMEIVKPLFKKMMEKDKGITMSIVEKYLGENAKISETSEKQLEQVLMIIDEFKETLEN